MKKLFLALVTISLISSSAAVSFGAAPGFTDLGEIERGSTESFNIYVTTDSEFPFTISPSILPAFSSTMFDQNAIPPDSVSEQRISEWFELPEEKLVDDLESRTYTLSDGSSVTGVTSFEVNLRVPRTAEPGYHLARIELNPERQSENGEGFGTQTRGVSVPQVMFRVPGTADRDLQVSDISAVRTGESEVQVVATVRNSGTVSVGLGSSAVNLTRGGEVMDTLKFGAADPLNPGETRRLGSYWISNQVEGGNYQITGNIGYKSARVPIRDSVSITGSPQPALVTDDGGEEQQQQPQEEANVPYLLIFGVFIGLASLLYVIGLDIVWVLAISGLSGIAIFITTAGLPVYVLVAGVLGAGILLYMEM